MPLALSHERRVMTDLFWDVGSRSVANLRICGPWNYAAHPSTEILCLCYALDDGEAQTWLPGQAVRGLSWPRRVIRQTGD